MSRGCAGAPSVAVLFPLNIRAISSRTLIFAHGRSRIAAAAACIAGLLLLALDLPRAHRDGVAAFEVKAAGVLSITVGSETRHLAVMPYEPERGFYRDCGNGRIVKVGSRRDMAEDRRAAVCR